MGRTQAVTCAQHLFVNFNSLAPCGANLIICATCGFCCAFQLTRPVWGEPKQRIVLPPENWISTHSPRVGRTFLSTTAPYHCVHFNSLAPCGANPYSTRLPKTRRHFNSLAPCGANPFTMSPFALSIAISTHSPRVGRTSQKPKAKNLERYFNSLAPCGANHGRKGSKTMKMTISTHSPRVGRTHVTHKEIAAELDFNSLAPCGANHSLRKRPKITRTFQLTRPVWGEPRLMLPLIVLAAISTHSPRVGRTSDRRHIHRRRKNFNSLAPCGANPGKTHRTQQH